MHSPLSEQRPEAEQVPSTFLGTHSLAKGSAHCWHSESEPDVQVESSHCSHKVGGREVSLRGGEPKGRRA